MALVSECLLVAKQHFIKPVILGGVIGLGMLNPHDRYCGRIFHGGNVTGIALYNEQTAKRHTGCPADWQIIFYLFLAGEVSATMLA